MENTGILVEEASQETFQRSFFDRKIENAFYNGTLPYERLSGEGFERLCYLILMSENQTPHFFGRHGQKDYGVDLTSEGEEGKFTVYQCKNWGGSKEKLTENDFESIFNEFNKQWIREQKLKKPNRYILCTSVRIDRDTPTHTAFINIKQDFEKRYRGEWNQPIRMDFWDRIILDEKLKNLPNVVVDMFNEDMAVQHCGGLEDWDFEIFISVRKSQQDKIIKNYFEKRGKIYIPDEWREDFFDKLKENKKLLIKGFPGSRKTTISLELANKFLLRKSNIDKRCYVYYVDFKKQPSLDELKRGIKRRCSLPSVFIFDDYQRELEKVKALSSSIDSIIRGKNVFCVYLYQTTLIEDKERDEDSEYIDFFEDSVLELKTDCMAFSDRILDANGRDISKQNIRPNAEKKHVKNIKDTAYEKGVDIGIIIALKEEFREFFPHIEKRYEFEQDPETGYYYYLFEYPANGGKNYLCAAVCMGGMGPDIAAITTDTFIRKWQPGIVVVIGIAASLSEDARLGDVVAAYQVDCYIDNAKAVDGEKGRKFELKRGGNVYPCSREFIHVVTNFEFAHKAAFKKWLRWTKKNKELSFSEPVLSLLVKDKYMREQPVIVEGHLASGPVVGASKDFRKWILDRDRTIKALEMEGGGVLSAVYSRVNSKKTLILRGISDYGDDLKKKLDKMDEGGIRRYAVRNAVTLFLTLLNTGVLPKKSMG